MPTISRSDDNAVTAPRRSNAKVVAAVACDHPAVQRSTEPTAQAPPTHSTHQSTGETMKHPFTRSRRISKLALLAVLALVVISAPTTTSAAPASTNTAHRWPSEPADASHVSSSAQIPTLTNNVGQPAGGADWQLPVGAGLLAAGLLGLVYALTTRLTSDRRPKPLAPRAHAKRLARSTR